MNQHDIAIELASNYKGASLNEASTRHEIIDRIIHGVLDWPRQLVKPEEHNSEGYADYVFYRPDRKRILVLEAKKEGAYFELPTSPRFE